MDITRVARRGWRVGVKVVPIGVLGGPDVVFEALEVGEGVDVEEADGWVCKELQIQRQTVEALDAGWDAACRVEPRFV